MSSRLSCWINGHDWMPPRRQTYSDLFGDGMTADYVIARLGEIYAGHPDYREEWRP